MSQKDYLRNWRKQTKLLVNYFNNYDTDDENLNGHQNFFP